MKALITLSLAIFATSVFAQSASPWRSVDEIARTAGRASNLEGRVITISTTHAQNATQAINDAIVASNRAGGGRVVIPRGLFHTGPIVLLSNVNLHLEEGAVLRFSTNPREYTPLQNTRWESIDSTCIKPMIYAYKQTNVAITGPGTLDGQASTANWWRERVEGQSVAHRRDSLFPSFIRLYGCRNVLIEGVTILNAPFWVVHLAASERVVVRNCRIRSGYNGITIEGTTSGASRNVFVDDCEINSPRLQNVLHIRANPSLGSVVEDIHLRSIRAGSSSHAIFFAERQSDTVVKGSHVPTIRNISLENITSRGSRYALFIDGLTNGVFARNVTIRNSTFEGIRAESLNRIFGTENVTFVNTTFTNDPTYKSVGTLREMTNEERRRIAEQRRREFLQQQQQR